MSAYDSVEQSDLSSPWWEEKAQKNVLPKIQRLFRYYVDQDRDRINAYAAYSALYTNRDIFGNDYLQAYNAAFSQSDYSRVPLNVSKVMVDAVHARLTRPAISVEFLPAGANWSLRRRSKQMGQFVRQQMHACSLRDKEDSAVLDALTFGIGVIKTAPHPMVPQIENFRVHPRDIFVDPSEAAATGKPTHLYHRMWVSRGRLAKLFPSKKAKIRAAKSITAERVSDWATDDRGQGSIIGDMVEVVEAYKLPSWTGAGDGRKVIFIDDCILDITEWDAIDFPFSFEYWKKDPTVGFFGIGLVEELIGLHFDINTSLLHVEKCIELMPKPYILVPVDGEVNEGKLGNVPGIIINHTGRAPKIVLPPSVPQDVVNYIGVQWQRSLQVSRLVAMGLPESAGSQGETGQAFKDIVDIQSTELSTAFRYREDFCIRVAEQQIIAGKQLDDREPGGFKTVLRKDRNTVEAVDWSQFDLDPKQDSYVVQASPTSALSTTFGGRLAEMKELIGLGMVPPSRAFKYLDIPDFDAEANIQNASLDLIERIIEEILDDGKYTEPEPTMDLRLGLKVCQKYINLAQAMGVEEERVNLLYQFLRAITDLIAEEQEATQMQASGMGPGLPGQPPAQDITGAAPGATSLSGTVLGQ